MTVPETMLRREKVTKMLSEGVPYRDIARELNISMATVNRDVKWARLEIGNMLDSGYREKLMQDTILQYEQTYQELWRVYTVSEDEKIRVFLLRNITDLIGKRVDTMQKLGIVSSTPMVNAQNTQQVVKLVWVDARKKEEDTK